MKIYSVYTSTKENEEPIIIPQERSYIAGIFNLLWALYHRMWIVAGITILFNIAISILVAFVNYTSFAYVAESSIILIYVLFASDMREYSAKYQGYKLADIVVASNEDEAEMKFYNRLEDWSSFNGDNSSNETKQEIGHVGTKIVNPW